MTIRKNILSLIINSIIIVLFFGLFLIIGGAAIIILFLLIPVNIVLEYKFKKKYEEYLLKIGDKNFFCYNNRKKGKEFIENEIIPFLNKDIEIIYLDGRTIKSNDYENKYFSYAFNRFENYSKFPHLMKIKNGEMKDISINNEFYNAINNNGDKSKLSLKMNTFFGVEESINNKPQKHL